MNSNFKKVYIDAYASPRKSFYGKCYVLDYNSGEKVLYSYDTIIATVRPGGGLIRHWDGYSPTTMRHINAFLKYCGMNRPYGMSKSEWENLPIVFRAADKREAINE